MVKLLFTRNHSFESGAIRFFTWSKYSHVEIVCRSGLCVGSSLGLGVYQRPLEASLRKATVYQYGYVDADSYVVEAFIDKQMGKPYDLTALFGFLARRDWQRDDRWFCSELVAAALSYAGVAIVCKPTGRVTPQDELESPVVTLAEPVVVL